MNQLRPWILCAALCFAAISCNNPDKTGTADPASSKGDPDLYSQAAKQVIKAGESPKSAPQESAKTRPEIPKTPSDVARPPKDAKRTRRGVSYKVLKKGTGTRHPKPTDRVEVHYSGWTTNGKMFDSSVSRGERITFGLNGVIPGWTDGLQTMVEGEKTRFWIPEGMAYRGQPGSPRGMLVFDVELFHIR